MTIKASINCVHSLSEGTADGVGAPATEKLSAREPVAPLTRVATVVPLAAKVNVIEFIGPLLVNGPALLVTTFDTV